MRALYLEPFAGISGNMLLGALLDSGVPFEYLKNEFAKLHLGDYELIHKSVNKSGIQAQYFDVLLPEGQEQHHGFNHEGNCHVHEHHHSHTLEQNEEPVHDHAWMHAHGIAHSHDAAEAECPEHCGHHEHHHVHGHHHHHEHRNLHDIEEILDGSELAASVITKAKEVFLAIAEAEAKVHGSTVEEIHFHEVGAIDTIIDVVGNILALQYLGIDTVFTAPVNTGFGFVECAHGKMPVPAPATAELLKGMPHYRGEVDKEMTTPTGAALLKVLAVPVQEVPAGFTSERIGYGAGTREVSIPNVLRVSVGTYEESKAAVRESAGLETLVVLECNIDNMNPEILPYVLDKLLEAGAKDAWLQPVVMKKGRPAQMLKVLCQEALQQKLQQIIFAETTTLGIRSYQVIRVALERRWKETETPWGKVRVKEGLLEGRVINSVPEFEDCKRVAQESGQPLKTVESAALQNYR